MTPNGNKKRRYASDIVKVYRAGTPYNRLMQMSVVTKTNHSVTYGFKSLVSTGIGQWSVMHTYWCYSGEGHEKMTARALPSRMAWRVEILGQIRTFHCWAQGLKRKATLAIRFFVRQVQHSVCSYLDKKRMRYCGDEATRAYAKFMGW